MYGVKKKRQESMDRRSSLGDITEILLKTALNTINQTVFSKQSRFRLTELQSICRRRNKLIEFAFGVAENMVGTGENASNVGKSTCTMLQLLVL